MKHLGNQREEDYLRLYGYACDIRRESLRRLEELTGVLCLLTEEIIERK